MRKKVCLVGYYGYGNFGDDLMLKLLTELLIAQHYDVSVISKNKCNFISDKVNQVITEGRWLTWVYIYNFIKHNAIVWGGGTCLYSTNNNIKGLFGVLKRVFIAKILGCKFHFLGIGIEPSSNKIADFIYRLILTLSDEIICRDFRSHSILDSYKKNSIVKSDLTYLLEKESRMTSSKSGKKAGDYILFCPAGYKNAYDNLDKLSNLMILLYIRYNKKIVLSSLHDGIDESFINVLHEKLNNKIEIEISYARDINEKISDLSNAYFIIGMRLHSIIIADVFNIPVFGISYQDKVTSYLSRFNFLGNPRFFDIFDEYDFELLTSSISEQQESLHVSDFVSSEKNDLNKSIIQILGG